MSALGAAPPRAQLAVAPPPGRLEGERPRAPAGERLRVAGAVAAAALAGSLFGPVFGSPVPHQLILPVAVVSLVTYGCYEAGRTWRWIGRWRAPIAVILGTLGLAESSLRSTTVHGVPTAATARALYHGAHDSWLLTLQSTWPARPDADLLLFVPVLVLVAAVLGVQVLTRTTARLPALAPSLAVAGLAQAYHPLSLIGAASAALGYAVAAAAVLGTVSRSAGRNTLRAVGLAVPVIVAGALVAGAADLADRPPYSLQAVTPPVSVPAALTNPLDEVAFRLEHPDKVLFSDRTAADVDRWPILVLDRFDGVNWTSSARYRQLGSRLPPDPAVRMPTSRHEARITLAGLPGPWLPSQQRVVSATGVRPLVDEATGTLLSTHVNPGLGYRLSWASPDVSGEQLAEAGVDSTASGDTQSLGAVPSEVIELANTAVHGLRPSFQTALLLEQYLRQHYRLAIGDNLPTGHGWPQIVHFLDPANPRGGTTEQFAAAYVVLARTLGIPARLVVGFRQPSHTEAAGGSYVVRNADAFAWPEVAVRGVGWVPLDPRGVARGAGINNDPSGLVAATSQARRKVQVSGGISPRQVLPPPPKPGRGARLPAGWLQLLAGLSLACLLSWLIGVPLAKTTRRALRRRRTGSAAVLAAWLEARDGLRDHGVPVALDMTVRDVAVAAGTVVPSRQTVHALRRLGALVDTALWSGLPVGRGAVDDAWQVTGAVRHDLAGRSIVARLVGALALRSLRSPH